MKSRVLIVDDELLIINLLKTRLTREDLLVDIARDGQEALKKASSKKYDLILTDLMVPNVAGRELIMQIQQSKLNANTPIIVLSSLSSDELIVDVLAAGVKDYIVKPFSVDVIVAKIKQLLIPKLSVA
ncbi:response regulator transcription factor [Daejeonella sp.]|uniref:response regulator transcription factor n=1 Tax=Daejeonella sp. TaxID=2805397 RepID=UPI0030C64CAD